MAWAAIDFLPSPGLACKHGQRTHLPLPPSSLLSFSSPLLSLALCSGACVLWEIRISEEKDEEEGKRAIPDMWGPCASADVYWRPTSGGETNKERDEQSQQSQVAKCWRLRKAHLWMALSGWAAYPNTYSPLIAPWVYTTRHIQYHWIKYQVIQTLRENIHSIFVYSRFSKEEVLQKLLHFKRVGINIRNQVQFLWYIRWCVSWPLSMIWDSTFWLLWQNLFLFLCTLPEPKTG